MIKGHPTVRKLDESGNVRLGFVEHDTYLAVLNKLPQHHVFRHGAGILTMGFASLSRAQCGTWNGPVYRVPRR